MMKWITHQNIKDQIIKEVEQFNLLTKWIGGHSLNGLKKDNYSIFNIPVKIDYVLDIGTCIGEVAYACSRLFPDAYIVAVEACPSTYFGAAKNLRGTNIRIDHFGISKKDNDLLFINDEFQENIGSKTTNLASEKNCNCLGISFESLLNRHNIDLNKNCLLKIDCEGCERYVFNKPELCQKFYQISCEMHNMNAWGNDAKLFYEKMQETHNVIRGKCTLNGRPEIVFRKK